MVGNAHRRCLRRRARLAGAAVAGVGAVVLTSASLASATPTGHSVTGALAAQFQLPKGQFYGVTALDADHAWEVGVAASSTQDAGGPSLTYVRSWDGSQWTTQTTPNPGVHYNELRGVAATAPDDVWAVGDGVGHGLQTIIPVILHWDGSAWSSMSIDAQKRGELVAVNAISSSDAWAVGGGLAVHWDGTGWTVVQTAPIPPHQDYVDWSGVAASGSTDVWAVGLLGTSSGSRRAVIEHYDGTSWQIVHSPRSATTTLYGVTAVGPKDAYATGYRSPSSGHGVPVVEHWDGTSWKVVKLPDPPAGFDILTSVGASSSSDVWAVGYDTQARTLTYHFDGTSWDRVASPNPPTGEAYLYGVSATSGSDAWAVGSSHNGAGYHLLTLHWDGSSWSITG